MPRGLLDRESIELGIKQRWGAGDWVARFPWWRAPAEVRILIYADGAVRFAGGGFLGMQYVNTLLNSRAYPYVRFHVDFVHRDGLDPDATFANVKKKLTELDIMARYDQIWFFGINGARNPDPGIDLEAAEHALLDQFVAAPKFGGILVTGDHADLGRSLAGYIRRAGKMRLYPAPPNQPDGWNTTLTEGPDSNFGYDFDDQSDDRPQTIRWRRYPLGFTTFGVRRFRPHPLLCGPDGPISVLPDHQHEGEALAPVVAPGDPEWPTRNGYQEKPQVIAWGTVKDPQATKYGQEIGLLSAYDGHNVDVGRILADSTWHHWFDINLTGRYPAPSPYAGFDETPEGGAVLKQLDAFFLNVGVWLSPPARQAEMRAAAWWSILWDARFVEMSAHAPIEHFGRQALDALNRRAPRCTVSSWVTDWPIFKEKMPHWEWPMFEERFQLISLPFETYVAGGIARELHTHLGAGSGRAFPSEAIAKRELEAVAQRGAAAGLAMLATQLDTELKSAQPLVAAQFDLRQVK